MNKDNDLMEAAKALRNSIVGWPWRMVVAMDEDGGKGGQQQWMRMMVVDGNKESESSGG